jgi:hypothetical protein
MTRNRFLFAGLLIAALAAAPTWAAIQSGAGEGKKSPRAEGPYQLRCWQEGRVIIELSGQGDPQAAGDVARRLSGVDTQGRQFDISPVGAGLCMVTR